MPAVATLLESGRDVVGVARSGDLLATVGQDLPTAAGQWVPLAHDAADRSFPRALRTLLDARRLRLGAAIVYAPASSPDVMLELTSSWDIPVVEVLTSATGAPRDGQDWSLSDLAPVGAKRRRLVLGWQVTATGSAWHSPEQISRAALNALWRPGDHLLGVLAPWSKRPP